MPRQVDSAKIEPAPKRPVGRPKGSTKVSKAVVEDKVLLKKIDGLVWSFIKETGSHDIVLFMAYLNSGRNKA